jgi:predicted unusual protein kinase regulating ubiquinone biosynthesis (AarF/ABC1/UbiB family)
VSEQRRSKLRRPKQSSLQRQAKILRALGKILLNLSTDFLLGNDRLPHQRRQAQKLVNTLISLGPTFIKMGQTISTRVDLLPSAYVEALGQLQDRVPPFATNLAIEIIETELGKPLGEIYREFEARPIAAASLGQVHRARLHDGTMVVVKVQRPGLEELFKLDFQILQQILNFCEKRFPWTSDYGLTAIYRDFFNLLFQEIDYRREGQNADRFRHNFRRQKKIVSPLIYWRFTTSKVLTMSYLPGIKIDQRQDLLAAGFDPRQINQIGICCYLQQLMIDGFFQGDPHPGNMAVTATGQLAVYDFGMMTELPIDAKERSIDTFLAIVRRDTEAVMVNLQGLGLLVEVEDMQPVRQVIGFLLERFTERPVNLQEFEEIRSVVASMYAQQPFRLPPEMTAILKALSTLDGIARTLDPQYNLILAARPFIQRIAITERRTLIRKVGQQALELLRRRGHPQSRSISIQSVPIQSMERQRPKVLLRLRLLARGVILTGAGLLTLAVGSLLGSILAPVWLYGCFGVAVFSGGFGCFCLIRFFLLEKIDPALR